jgi:O-antigen/teichoic acid export membrane protein
VPSLGQRTLVGLLWQLFNTLGGKAVGMTSQIVLAYLLSKNDFGVVGLAYAVTSFISLIANPGIDTVLVHRGKELNHWITPAFWMGLTCGISGGLLMAAAAPIVGRVYGNAEIVRLILILSVAAPLRSLSLVPEAVLVQGMRFRPIALLNLAMTALGAALSVAFALSGFGASSFVLPFPILAFTKTCVVWLLVRPRVELRLQLGRWRKLAGDCFAVFFTSLLPMAAAQGDYIILGLFTSPKEVGVYFFAFTLSMQALNLAAGSAGNVLFPAFTRLQNSSRLGEAAFRAMTLLAYVAIPLCFLQAFVARPLVQFLYGQKWIEAVPVIQLLSLGFAVDAATWVGSPFMQAQGAFGRYLRVQCIYCPLYLLLVGLGAWWNGLMGVAIAASFYYGIATPFIWAWVIGRSSRTPLTKFLKINLMPALVAGVSMSFSTLLSQLIPSGTRPWWLARMFVVATLGILIYLLASTRLMPQQWTELRQRLTEIVGPLFVRRHAAEKS